MVRNAQSNYWGIEPPPLPKCSISSGVLIEGTYKVTVTYATASGKESGANYPILLNVPANSSIIVSNIAPSSNPLVSYINIYFATGTELYFYKQLLNVAGQHITINSQGIYGRTLKTLGMSIIPYGDLLEYYNGRLFVATGNVIWFSEPFAYDLCNIDSNYIMLDSEICVMGAVNDGLWIATKNQTYFAQADTPPFRFIDKSNYGAIKGTQCRVPLEYILDSMSRLQRHGMTDSAYMWASSEGIYLGMDGGHFKNLTKDYFASPDHPSGSSLFRQERGINQFICSIKSNQETGNVYSYEKNSTNITLPRITMGGN